MDINLEYYKIFYYVGKTGSITAAAEALHVSQPAVSQGIKNLERALGSPCFIRTTKGVRFTTEGQVLFQYVEKAFQGLKTGEQKFREMQDLESGQIRIGASDMTLRFYLVPFLEKFHQEYPKIKVSVTNAPTPRTLKHIKDGLIDFGVVSSPVKTKEHLVVKPVREIEDVFVAGERFKELRRNTISYSSLVDYPFMCLDGQTSSKQYVTDFLAEKGVHLTPEIELATSDMLVLFARKGFGITCVVKDFAKEALLAGDLFEIPMEEKIPNRQMCLVWEQNTPISPAAQKLVEWMSHK